MELESVFTSAIEVGIAIAGFSGIVAIFGRRITGEWTRADRGRMGMLLRGSFATVLLSFLPLVLVDAIDDRAALWTICSAVYVVYALLSSILQFPRVRELRRDPENEIDDTYFALVTGALAVTLALQLANAIWWKTGWPHAVAVLFTMTVAFTQFVRLMRILWRSGSS